MANVCSDKLKGRCCIR